MVGTASYKVSVPFGDSIYLNSARDLHKALDVVSVPFGDSIYLNAHEGKNGNTYSVSVPFGDSIYLNNVLMLEGSGDMCFRPLRGLYISKFPLYVSIVSLLLGFRPLRGLYISK